jgi:hypothetical protein
VPYLPELPARGPGADLIGRAAGLLVDLPVDLQPSGWRLVDRPGVDLRRARDLLARDLDALEEVAEGYAGPLKVQVAGPWTLAATVERPRGDRVLADHGARRELAQALAEGGKRALIWDRPNTGYSDWSLEGDFESNMHADTLAGLIIGAFGAGAVTAAFVVAGRVAGSPLRMAATLVLLGSGVIAFSLTPWLTLGFVFLFIGGFGYLASNTAATTRLQLGVAEAQRGRIMALWSVAFLGLRPVASITDGALANVFGVRAAGVVLALPALAVAGLTLAMVGRADRNRR